MSGLSNKSGFGPDFGASIVICRMRCILGRLKLSTSSHYSTAGGQAWIILPTRAFKIIAIKAQTWQELIVEHRE